MRFFLKGVPTFAQGPLLVDVEELLSSSWHAMKFFLTKTTRQRTQSGDYYSLEISLIFFFGRIGIR